MSSSALQALHRAAGAKRLDALSTSPILWGTRVRVFDARCVEEETTTAMATRRDTLLRLHKCLLTRRAALRNALAGELADLRGARTAQTGDSADAIFDAGSEEIASQLAEIEARELTQIDHALQRLKQGTYGICGVCQAKIPIARLNALPYTATCSHCQREIDEIDGQREA